MSSSLARERAHRYAAEHHIEIETELGFGFDGIVLSTNRQSAIKSFWHEPLYHRERDVYRRLTALHVTEIMGFKIPRLVQTDDLLWIVEMTIVSPPFVLDFAGAALDRRPQYPDDVLAEWQAEKAEQFGERWPTVRLIMSSFVGLGIYLADVKPGNIEFPAEPPTHDE
ncbi:MAG: hypothetical protein AABP62_29445 [Planctomycetota bacterium]